MDVGLDRYDLNARLRPALLTLLPLLLLTAVWLRDVWSVATGLLGLVVFCGVLFLMSRVARSLGRGVQKTIEQKLGGLPTTIMLRHSDNTIDRHTKERYHSFLRQKVGRVPTEDEERLSLRNADEAYRACVSWLLEATRDQQRFRMIADENIDYGFRRNLVGLKPVAIVIVGLALAVNTVALVGAYRATNVVAWDAIALDVVLLLVMLTWVFFVRIDFAVDAARSYATRLLAACDLLQA